MYSFPTCPDAIALINGGADAPNLTGQIQFYQKSGWVLVVTKLSGLPENKTGFYAMHIHRGNSCSGLNFSETGGHYDPEGEYHPKHAGDLPPLLSCRGEAYLAVQSDRFSVRDIIGKTVVIHSDADDFNSQPAGNAGTKIACGVIKRMRDCRH